MLRTLSTLFLLACSTGAAGAQEELAPSFDDLVEVSEVLLDVLAVDEDGNVVTGLGKDDFVVEEDGEPVPITGVSYYATRYDESGEAEEIPASRYFVLFFDMQQRSPRYGSRMLLQRLRASRDLQRWVEEEMTASDWMAVVRWDGKLEIYQEFTQEAGALAEAIRRAAAGKPANSYLPAGRRHSPGRSLELARRLQPPVRGSSRENLYQALGRLAEATGYIVGRKNLLMLTTGFGEEKGLYRSEPDPDHYPELETRLNDHNVAVYPIDLTPAGLPPMQEDFLERLATDTGGYYDPNFVGFLNPVKEVADDNLGYYLLSYQSARPAGEIGYQRLEVRARNPEVQVRARRGYRYGL